MEHDSLLDFCPVAAVPVRRVAVRNSSRHNPGFMASSDSLNNLWLDLCAADTYDNAANGLERSRMLTVGVAHISISNMIG